MCLIKRAESIKISRYPALDGWNMYPPRSKAYKSSKNTETLNEIIEWLSNASWNRDVEHCVNTRTTTPTSWTARP